MRCMRCDELGCGMGEKKIEKKKLISDQIRSDQTEKRTGSDELRDVPVARHLALWDLLYGAVHGDEEGRCLVGSRHWIVLVSDEY